MGNVTYVVPGIHPSFGIPAANGNHTGMLHSSHPPPPPPPPPHPLINDSTISGVCASSSERREPSAHVEDREGSGSHGSRRVV